ncbi:MAG: phosphatase PAP2 family protein [Bacteroidetes bacterium]|nr:phosphatase PAP2 family protein [Bacteroidota bacterium]
MLSQLFSTSESPQPTKSAIVLSATLAILIVIFIPVFIFDNSLFLLINGLHSPFTDLIWLALTTLGDGLLLGIIVGAFLLVNPRVTVMGLLLMILSSAVVHFVKAVYPHLRPAEVFQTAHVVGPLLRFGSFPSGHAAAAMSAGLAIAFFCRSRVIGAVVIAIASLIGLSRIFVGAHFPADVLGGMICAVGVLLTLVSTAWPELEKHVAPRPSLSRKRFRVAFAAEVLAVIYSLFVYAWHSAELPPFAALVAVVVLIIVIARYRRIASCQAHKGTDYA